VATPKFCQIPNKNSENAISVKKSFGNRMEMDEMDRVDMMDFPFNRNLARACGFSILGFFPI